MSLSAQVQNLKDSLQCVEHDLGVQIDIRQQLQESVPITFGQYYHTNSAYPYKYSRLDHGRRASEKLVQDLERNIDSMEDEVRFHSLQI